MKSIFKYEINLRVDTALCHTISAPADSKILKVGAQGDSMFVWMEVNPDNKDAEYLFEVFGTGDSIHEDMGVDRKYLETVFMFESKIVAHVYHRAS